MTKQKRIEPPLIVQALETASGDNIGIFTLNDPKALNALSVEMCQTMFDYLKAWQDDDSIVAIILKGSGNKAFCAGGNIRKLYESMQARPVDSTDPNPYAEAFFANEYSLYRQMHFYKKPIILWANGIVMGGGMGLMAMASHRVVTENTRFAMPEISIGLYPDATGSWLLQRMPNKAGLFLGLTGANCNGADALIANMAEFVVTSDDYQNVVNTLLQADWQNKITDGLHHIASRALAKIHHSEHLAESNLLKHWQLINKICNQGSIKDIDNYLQSATLAEKYANDKWLSRAIKSYQHGCPVSAVLTYEIFDKAKKMSLEQILYMELNVSLNCANNADFQEGVRALLIDKDQTPKWSKTLVECTTLEGKVYIDKHFNSLYKAGKHPFDIWFT